MPTEDDSASTDRGAGRTRFPSRVATSSIFLALLVALVGILVAMDIGLSLAARDETRLLSTRLDQANSDDSDTLPPSSHPKAPDSVEHISCGQVTNLLASLPAKPTAQEIAEVLSQLGGWSFSDQELERVERVEIVLAAKLRKKVNTEVTALHKLALASANYSTGHEHLREAGATLALFPLSDDPGVLKEAEALSSMQRAIVARLEVIRRQRYNHWAAGQVEEALRILREDAKNATDAAVQSLCTIDPPLLEPAVASIYSYAIGEITDDLKAEKKTKVAKQLTTVTTRRKTLEDF